MASTTRGFRYPASTDAADVPADLHNLADDVQAELDGDLPVGSVTAAAGVVANGLTVPVAGAGVEIGYTGGIGFVQAQQRGPDASKPLALSGSEVRVTAGAGATRVATGTSTGVDFPLGFTGKRLDSPYFRAYRNAAASYANNAVMLFDTETDPNGWYDPATGKFQPTVAGCYRLNWRVAANAVLTAGKYWTTVAGNGAGQVGYQVGSAQPPSSGGSTQMVMNGSTDFAQVILNHDVGSATAIATGTSFSSYFEAERIGA